MSGRKAEKGGVPKGRKKHLYRKESPGRKKKREKKERGFGERRSERAKEKKRLRGLLGLNSVPGGRRWGN